jgi:hypothetical protein
MQSSPTVPRCARSERSPDAEQLELGEVLKVDGMAAADEHTDADWKAAADAAIAQLAATGQVFTSFDLDALGVPAPDKSARYGPRFLAASKAGLIVATGYAKSRRPTTHASIVRTWVGAEAAR